MPNIKINSCISNNIENNKQVNNCIGKLENNKIYYEDENTSVTILLNTNKIDMIRKGKEYNLELTFKQNSITSGNYDIDKVGVLNLKIHTIKMDIMNNSVHIEYILRTDEVLLGNFIYDLSYEVI